MFISLASNVLACSQLWTSQNIKCKDKEKAMQKQGKGDVLIKKELENI